MSKDFVLIIERKNPSTKRWEKDGMRLTWKEAERYGTEQSQHRGGAWRIRKFLPAKEPRKP